MRLAGVPGCHLTYCTNIHPGESWPEVRAAVETHVLDVKRRLLGAAAREPFGVGLRLSAAAAAALSEPDTFAAFADFLRAHDLYVFTINGFPYGAFHGTRVKERVYRPDWLEDERVSYSDRLARLLAALIEAAPPRGGPGAAGGPLEGSVSTVPGCFQERAAGPEARPALARAIARHAATLWRLGEGGAPFVGLALEPEPACVMETTADAIAFLTAHVFSGAGLAAFAAETGLGGAEAEGALRRHVGVCLDACHAAVEFEDPAACVRALAGAGVRVLKLQVSAGLRIRRAGEEARAALARFAEGVYLHQVVVRGPGGLRRFVDLPDALAAAGPGSEQEEWRVHFHVPLFLERLPPFENTQAFLSELLALEARAPFTAHLEAETYTWDVLPEEYRREPVTAAIARELRWTLDRLGASP
jgi:sugar phosphate isomerase/epimerase